MKNLLPFILLLGTFLPAKGQIAHIEAEQGLYDSPENLISNAPGSICNLRKIRDSRVDTIVDRCWFSDRDKGMIKTAFAVKFGGQLYISEQSMRKQLSDQFSDAKGDYNNRYYRVLNQGRYLYTEVLFHQKDPELGIVMGIMGGVVGNAVGTSLAETKPVLCAVVFDSTSKTFFSFTSNHDVVNFLKAHHPFHSFNPEGSAWDLKSVQQLFEKLQ